MTFTHTFYSGAGRNNNLFFNYKPNITQAVTEVWARVENSNGCSAGTN
jgi:hypothetical protein